MKKIILTITSLSLLIMSCSSIESIKGKDKAETYYLRGMAYLEENMYEQALQKFNIVKNKFPYSKYAIEAELKIADTYYEKDDYLEAQKSYTLFSELHPNEARRDYAIYKAGMSFYSMLPSSVDRDLEYAQKAISKFKVIMDRFKKSSYYKDSVDKYVDVKTRLAGKEIYIANFYWKKDKYLSAAKRFEKVLKLYPGLGLEEDMYYNIGRCYSKLDEKEKASYYYDLLQEYFPDGKYNDKVKKFKGRL